MSFVLYCVPDHPPRTYSNNRIGEEGGRGGAQVVFAISCKDNLPNISVPPFNVTDCNFKIISVKMELYHELERIYGCLNMYFKYNIPYFVSQKVITHDQ